MQLDHPLDSTRLANCLFSPTVDVACAHTVNRKKKRKRSVSHGVITHVSHGDEQRHFLSQHAIHTLTRSHDTLHHCMSVFSVTVLCCSVCTAVCVQRGVSRSSENSADRGLNGDTADVTLRRVGARGNGTRGDGEEREGKGEGARDNVRHSSSIE